jgi:hypothetical protein
MVVELDQFEQSSDVEVRRGRAVDRRLAPLVVEALDADRLAERVQELSRSPLLPVTGLRLAKCGREERRDEGSERLADLFEASTFAGDELRDDPGRDRATTGVYTSKLREIARARTAGLLAAITPMARFRSDAKFDQNLTAASYPQERMFPPTKKGPH